MPIDKGGKVLLDTGFFVAIHNTRDRKRETALGIFDALKDVGAHLLTSDYVLDEAVTTAFVRTQRREVASEVGRSVIDSKHVTLLLTDLPLLRRSLEAYEKYQDKNLSFTDCLLLALSSQHRIGHLVSFDEEFTRIPDGPIVVQDEGQVR